MKTATAEERLQNQLSRHAHRRNERGSATVIALLVLGLMTIFVSLALSRTTTEALIMGNDAAEARSAYASQASIETMSRNFNKIYDLKLSPTAPDIANVISKTPAGFTGFTFTQTLTRTGADQPVVLTGGAFEGLTALRDPWRIQTIATGPTGVQVEMARTFFSNRIPIFQFGLFYNDDMELSPGADFDFGGRVHANGNIFIRGGGRVQFNSRVTASKEVVVDKSRNGYDNIASPSASEASAGFGQNIWIKNATGTFQQLKMGAASVTGGPDVPKTDSNMPDGDYNSSWNCKATLPTRYACRPSPDIFDGNLIADVSELKLPLKLGGADEIDLIKRGLSADNTITALSRYYNKPGIRITLSDSQAKLPGGAGGVRLDANYDALGALNGTGAKFGYKAKKMTGVVGSLYTTSRFNAYRLYRGGSRETWIKVENVKVDDTTLAITTTDITEDFLSLGFTERAPLLATKFQMLDAAYDPITSTTPTDSRAILKMQRWAIPGPPVLRSAYADSTKYTNIDLGAGSAPVCSYIGTVPNGYSYHSDGDAYYTGEKAANGLAAKINGGGPLGVANETVVPFPIEMFDAREGIAQESTVTYADLAATSGTPADTISYNGVMSMIDIDVDNLRDFLRGDFDGQFPNGLKSTDITIDRGWIVYVSDRRGDLDDDGEYDMEDIYGPNDGTLQTPEDVNHNGALDVDWNEAARYSDTEKADVAAFKDHKYYRRGVRLINASQLPGDKNHGLTVASENGIYIFGNYNATGVASHGTPTAASDYQPGAVTASAAPWIANNSQVPASVAADAVTILSNPWDGSAGWSDGASFGSPMYSRPIDANAFLAVDYPGRPARETTVRAAILMGDTISSIKADPNQGGVYSERLNGGVNNFKRFLEEWRATSNPYVNYSGSLINLFNSVNNNGAFKYGSVRVYNAPNRNWVFDDSFLDATRLPPGTPFFQYLQVTGFQRINN